MTEEFKNTKEVTLQTVDSSNNLLINNLAEQLLEQADTEYKINNKFSDEVLLSLNCLFGSVLERALELLDIGKFVIYQSNDNLRRVFRVKGTKGEEYSLFYHINYCTCQAFKYKVIHSSKELVCKHVLAARLAEITGKITVEVYTPRQIADLLNHQIIYE